MRVAHNELKTIPPCVAKTPNLRILDVGYNKISDWGDLSALRELNRLEQLSLRGCPIANDPEYAEKITRMCPGLKLLDGRKPRDARGRQRDGPCCVCLAAHLSARLSSHGQMHPGPLGLLRQARAEPPCGTTRAGCGSDKSRELAASVSVSMISAPR